MQYVTSGAFLTLPAMYTRPLLWWTDTDTGASKFFNSSALVVVNAQAARAAAALNRIDRGAMFIRMVLDLQIFCEYLHYM